jgi:hypothetical protein
MVFPYWGRFPDKTGKSRITIKSNRLPVAQKAGRILDGWQ